MPTDPPQRVQVSTPSLDTVEITVPAGDRPLLALLLALGRAVLWLGVAAMAAVAFLAALQAPSNHLGEALGTALSLLLPIATVAFIAEAGARITLRLAFSLWPREPLTITLGPTGLQLPGSRRVLFSEIALVSDEADLLLADGEEVSVLAGAPRNTRRWLADQIRQAHQRSGRGSASDVPEALRRARPKAQQLPS